MRKKKQLLVVKVSGARFKDQKKEGIFQKTALGFLAKEIRSVSDRVELAIVVGGGNIARGRDLIAQGSMDPFTADYVGMMATAINGTVLEMELKEHGMRAEFLNCLLIHQIGKPFIFKSIIEEARKFLKKNCVVIFGGGTGVAGITTDTAAVLIARSLNADRVLKGTDVEGVFTQDPKENAFATLIPALTHQEFLAHNFSTIFDPPAVTIARDKGIPIQIFKFEEGSLRKAVGIAEGQPRIGSLIY